PTKPRRKPSIVTRIRQLSSHIVFSELFQRVSAPFNGNRKAKPKNRPRLPQAQDHKSGHSRLGKNALFTRRYVFHTIIVFLALCNAPPGSINTHSFFI